MKCYKFIIFFFLRGSIILLPLFAFGQNFNTVEYIPRKHEVVVNVLQSNASDTTVVDRLESVSASEVEHINPLVKIEAFLPLKKLAITSPFGYRSHPVTGEANSFHSGVDLRAYRDTVYSVLHGKVISAGHTPLLGNYIKIKHGKYTSIYGHLSVNYLKVGDFVRSGMPIGITGSTGRVTGEHLHFTVKCNGEYINPLIFLSRIMTAKDDELAVFLNPNFFAHENT